REVGLTAEHVADLARLVDDLIHRDEREGDHAPVHDRAEAAAGGAETDAGEGGLRDGREAHALVAELLLERGIAHGREREDARVAPHLLGPRLVQGLLEADLPHRHSPQALPRELASRRTCRRADPWDPGRGSPPRNRPRPPARA